VFSLKNRKKGNSSGDSLALRDNTMILTDHQARMRARYNPPLTSPAAGKPYLNSRANYRSLPDRAEMEVA
jgi:hypothetical protein